MPEVSDEEACRLRERIMSVNDPVNHPSHYTQGGDIECIDAIAAMLSREQFIGFLRGQVIKYLWRADHKGSREQDQAKAKWYVDKLASINIHTPVTEAEEDKEGGDGKSPE